MSSPSSSSMSSSLSSRFCFNNGCSEFKLDHCRPGWRLRTGDFADLCDRCASAYEHGMFCDIFHIKASGWRCCESCGKRIHCGCIVSASAFMLLDAGGVQCMACARKKVVLGPNFQRSPSFFFQPPIAEKFTDFSGKNWSYLTGPNQITCRPPTLLGPSVLHNCGDIYEFSQPTSKDVLCSLEKRGVDDLMAKLISENSKSHTSDRVGYQKAGPNFKFPSCPNLNVYPPLTSFNDGPFETQLTLPVPITTPIETNGHSRLDRSNLLHAPSSSPLNYLHNDLNGGAVPLCESESQSLRPHLEAQAKYQVVPRYWPSVPYNSQDLQNLDKESKSIITPLFEKMLSASDTGRIGRLVLPKKCAEAFLPKISHPEGMPLKVQDSLGKDWTFQFRFWPNNNSRMYVLEGVTACMQNMQLQAGDTVIFSRSDPEEKLIMGFRKATVAQSSEQENDSANKYDDASTNGAQVEPGDPHSPSRVHNSAYIAKETLGVEFSTGKRSSTMNLNSKRQKVEKGDLTELKLTWEEAQGFLLPPPNFTPSIIVIDGIEFEEYEDGPIIGKPIVSDTDDTSFKPTCSADKELEPDQNEKEAMEEVEELPTSTKTTPKHPRHKSGCTCIVCIQFPSGRGPKHEQCCSCAVCETVKRRTHSMLLRRDKSRIEEETVHKELQSQGNSSASPLKGQIDLNIQPEKDEETLSGSEVSTKTRFMYLNATMKSSFDSPSSSTAYNQTDKEDEGIYRPNTGAEDSKSPAPN